MELMTKLKGMIPWKQKPAETHEVSLRDDINQLFDRFLVSPFETGWSRFAGFGSGIEMYETEEYVILRADIPGVDPKQLNIMIRNPATQFCRSCPRVFHNIVDRLFEYQKGVAPDFSGERVARDPVRENKTAENGRHPKIL